VLFSFLPISEYPELGRQCEGFENAIQQANKVALPTYFKTMGGALLGRISTRYPDMPADRILAIARQFIGYGIDNITALELASENKSKDELLALNPKELERFVSKYSLPFTCVRTENYAEINALGSAVSNLKDHFFISYFERIPVARQLLESLKPENLSIYETAEKLRNWVNKQENKHILDQHPVVAFVLKFDSNEENGMFPAEFLLDTPRGAKSYIQRKLPEEFFSNLPLDYRVNYSPLLESCLIEAGKNGHADVVEAIVNHSTFMRSDIIHYSRFVVTRAAANGHFAKIYAVLPDDVKDGIPSGFMGICLYEAAKIGCLEDVNEIIDCSKFSEIDPRHLQEAVKNAAKNNHNEVIEVLINSNRSRDIPLSGLQFNIKNRLIIKRLIPCCN